MSLDYKLTEIKDYKSVTRIKRDPLPSEQGFETDENGQIEIMNPKTEIIIFMMIPTKIGKITMENAAEFYARAHLIESIDGAWGKKPDPKTGRVEDWPITIDDVYAHIGLSANVATQSREEFYKQVNNNMDNAIAQFRDFHSDCPVGEDAERIQAEREASWI